MIENDKPLLLLTLPANASIPSVAVNLDTQSCATQLHRPPDDFMNSDTMSLSCPSCLGPPQLICGKNAYNGGS